MKRNALIIAALVVSVQVTAQKFDPAFNGSGWRVDTIGSGSNSGQQFKDALIQPGQKLVVCGSYDVSSTAQGLSLVRYNSDGSIDNSFGSNGKVYLNPGPSGGRAAGIARNTAGDLFVLGGQQNGQGAFYICKLSQNGNPDAGFGANGVIVDSALASGTSGMENARAIAVQSDGKILIDGSYRRTSPNTEYAAWVIRLNTDGSRDNSFGNNGLAKLVGGDNSFGKLLIQPDGKILAGGSSGLIAQQQQDWFLVRLKTNGTPDSTFGAAQDGLVKFGLQYRETVSGMGLQSDGSIVIGGPCGNGNPTFRIVRIKNNGLIDANFGVEKTSSTNIGYTNIELQTYTDHYFAGLAVLPDNKIAIAGAVSNFRFAAIRFTASGVPDSTFGTNAVVDSMFLPPNGVGTAGAVYDKGTGRLYVLGGTYDGNNSIMSSAVVAVKIAQPVGIAVPAANTSLKIYPNPASGMLHLTESQAAIKVWDMSGRIVLSGSGKSIDVSALASGWYLLRCTSATGAISSTQFVKE